MRPTFKGIASCHRCGATRLVVDLVEINDNYYCELCSPEKKEQP